MVVAQSGSASSRRNRPSHWEVRVLGPKKKGRHLSREARPEEEADQYLKRNGKMQKKIFKSRWGEGRKVDGEREDLRC